MNADGGSNSLRLRPVIVVSGMTLVAALLRIYHLGYKSIWYDEAVCFWAS